MIDIKVHRLDPDAYLVHSDELEEAGQHEDATLCRMCGRLMRTLIDALRPPCLFSDTYYAFGTYADREVILPGDHRVEAHGTLNTIVVRVYVLSARERRGISGKGPFRKYVLQRRLMSDPDYIPRRIVELCMDCSLDVKCVKEEQSS